MAAAVGAVTPLLRQACLVRPAPRRSAVLVGAAHPSCSAWRALSSAPLLRKQHAGAVAALAAQRAAAGAASRTLRPCSASSSSDKEAAPAPSKQSSAAPATDNDNTSLLSSVGLFVLWAGLAVYGFVLSPNQTPLRDSYFLEKLVGLGLDDGVPLNVIVQQLFLIMGVWPLVYTALLVPSGKSDNGIPAWPFLTLSYAFGAFGLLPFMALWQPPKQPPKVPADKADLEGVGNLMQKGMESPVVAFLCLAGAAACIGQAALAGPAQWNAYFKLLEESRFINVMSVDFLTLTTLAPFWMANDAALRKWDKRDTLLPLLSVLPVFGPTIYLCLRPRAQL